MRKARITCLALLLSGCGGVNVNLWPFGEGSVEERSRVPANATAYQCEGGKRLYVRYLDNGAAAWVIFREREFRLDRVGAGPGARYTNGNAVLETSDKETTLNDGPAIVFTRCKVASG